MKNLVIILGIMFLISSGCAYSAEASSSGTTSGITRSIFSKLIDTSVSKLNTVSNPLTEGVVNNVKLVAYKKQLELKKQELEELEASSTLGIIKWFRRRTINSQIEEIQKEINALENAAQ